MKQTVRIASRLCRQVRADAFEELAWTAADERRRDDRGEQDRRARRQRLEYPVRGVGLVSYKG